MGAAATKHIGRDAANAFVKKPFKAIVAKVEPVTCPSDVLKARQIQRSEVRDEKQPETILENNPMEMHRDILQQIERIDFTEKVEYLEQNDADFRKTASGHRTREYAADDYIQMPKDRTAASSSMNTTPEHTPGRLTFAEMRELLKLYHENKAAWTAAALATKFELDEEKIVNIIKHVGPPKVIPPSSNEAYPQGVWFL